MNLKNVEYTNYKNYMENFIKSLSNFCNKCPLKPTIKVVNEMGLVYVNYDDNEIEISVNANEDKKKIIGDLKKEIEQDYPIIYEKIKSVPNADDIRKMLDSGKTLEQALNSTQITYKPIYRIERCHDKYNELDLLSLSDKELYKFKCKIPVMAILEDLKYNGKDSDVLNNITLLYKLTINR